MTSLSSRLILAALLTCLVPACAGPSTNTNTNTESAPTSAPTEESEFAPEEPAAEHTWLLQLVGTWEVTSEADMGPDAPPMVMTSTERVRAVGSLWIQNELTSEFGGVTVTGLQTVGFDPETGRFVGTWIDSTKPILWRYDGELDAAGTTLALHAEGPDFEDPTRTRRYRDSVTVLGPGHRRMASSMQADDGTWVEFMTGEARRVGD
jgi:hypothetical protein